MASTRLMIIGIRFAGDEQLCWLDSDRADLAAGSRITVSGRIATVVVSADQFLGSVDPELVLHDDIGDADELIHAPGNTQAEELDRVLAEFPAPGSIWESEVGSGTVMSINVRKRIFDVKMSGSEELTTIQLDDEGNQD